MKITRIIERCIVYSLPVLLFLILFFFYGYAQTTPAMFNKIAGLLAFLLLGITLIIGPLAYFFPSAFDRLKIYRKYLGISGFFVAIVHIILSSIFYFHLRLDYMLFDIKNEHLLGVYMGLLAFGILLTETLISNEKAMKFLGSHNWKTIQMVSYAALVFAILHFFLIETNKGVFIIRRPLGKIIFVFGFIVLVVRMLVFLIMLIHDLRHPHK